jgi:hypothetical protein
MTSGSGLQDSVEKAREAFRRVSADESDEHVARMAPSRLEGPVRETRGGDVGQLHPFFQGLFEALPPPGTGWPVSKREQWLETARNIFALMYDDPLESTPGAMEPTPSLRPVESAWTPPDSEARLGQA